MSIDEIARSHWKERERKREYITSSSSDVSGGGFLVGGSTCVCVVGIGRAQLMPWVNKVNPTVGWGYR